MRTYYLKGFKVFIIYYNFKKQKINLGGKRHHKLKSFGYISLIISYFYSLEEL